MVAATIFLFVAALAVVGLSCRSLKLSLRETVVVVVLFGAFTLLWSGGLSYFGFLDLEFDSGAVAMRNGRFQVTSAFRDRGGRW